MAFSFLRPALAQLTAGSIKQVTRQIRQLFGHNQWASSWRTIIEFAGSV